MIPARRRRPHTGSTDGTRTWVGPMVAAVLLVALLGAFGVALAHSEADGRHELERRATERATVAAGMIESVFAAVGAQGAAEASRVFAGPVIPRRAFERTVSEGRLLHARIYGRRGRLLATAPDGIGSRGAIASDRAAPRTATTLSDAYSTPGGARAIDWRVPFPASDGIRLHVKGLPLGTVQTFLRDALARVPQAEGSGAYVVDGNGNLLGATPGAGDGRVVEPALAAALEQRRQGDYADGRWFTSARVAGSSWRVVIAGPQATLLATQGHPWVPRIVLAAFGLAALAALVLLRRTALAADRLGQANRAFEDANLALRDAQAVGHIGSWRWDVAGDRVAWSDELWRIYGVEPGEAAASVDAYLGFVHPDDRERVRALIDSVVRAPREFSFEERIVRPDGEVRQLQSRGEAVVDADGRLVRLIGVSQDVTERRRAESAARQAEQRFRHVFEHGPVAMALVHVGSETAGHFLMVNPALSELTGLSREELLRRDWPSILHPLDALAAESAIAALAGDGGRSLRIEQRCLRPDGEVRWLNVDLSLIREADGSPLYAVLQAQDMSDRKRFEDRLQHLAEHDPLTGLMNRRRFTKELEEQAALAARYGGGGAVLMVDIDHFKFVNDTLGHAAGDRLLARLAGILRSRLRSTDVVARLGGDEFAAILPRATREEAVHVAGDLLAAIREAPACAGGGQGARVTASIGVSMLGPGIESGEAVLVDADIAMYHAKQHGRDRVEVLDEGDGSRAHLRRHVAWVQKIRDAVRDGAFELYEQPIVDVGEPGGRRSELLVRMIGDDGEAVPPAAFLPAAEASGLVRDLDRWVVRRAIELIGRRRRRGDGAAKVQVNLSGATITDPGMREFVEREIRAAEIDPTALVFEVTETAAIVNIDKARGFAEALGELGCEIALDDFGAGFGSFYYLKHLPFDYLKIDGEFIRKLPSSRSDQLMVAAIVDIAHGLGKRVIAEFVESEETLDLLRSYGVDFVQGHHLGRPRPVAGETPGDERARRPPNVGAAS